nr:hypothetical protein [Pseudoglutamicibacter cumminsii]
MQLDRGLHAPLIIRDPQDAEDQDVEWAIVLDDWVDGIQGTPDDELDKLTGPSKLARAERPTCGLSTPAVTPSSRWPSVVTA